MRTTLLVLALTSIATLTLPSGCSSKPPDDGAGLPPRSTKDAGDNSSSSSSSSGGTSTTDGGYDCSKHAPVDDRPACDQCTRAKCCEQITKCDQSQQCAAAQKCLAACADGDTECILSCGATSGSGGDMLQELGACASNNCSSECPQPQPDGGDFDAF